MQTETAVRFNYSGGNVDFSMDEITSETAEFLKDFILQENALTAPRLYKIGAEYTIIEITFIEIDLTTYTKIQTLINSEEELTLYYRYKYNTATTVKVVPNLDEEIEQWSYGHRQAWVTHTIKFYIVD